MKKISLLIEKQKNQTATSLKWSKKKGKKKITLQSHRRNKQRRWKWSNYSAWASLPNSRRRRWTPPEANPLSKPPNGFSPTNPQTKTPPPPPTPTPTPPLALWISQTRTRFNPNSTGSFTSNQNPPLLPPPLLISSTPKTRKENRLPFPSD